MQNLNNLTIGFIGAGNMARSIIGGLINSGLAASQLMVSNPSPAKLEQLIADFKGIQISQDNAQVAQKSEILILAVKPQMMSQMLSSINHLDLAQTLIISVAAGVETETINKQLNKASSSLAIVRSMPNTPALVGQGATGLFANGAVSAVQKKQASEIFNAVGSCQWVSNESQMDLVTAISGSGPAHYFLFLEAVTDYAIGQGMEPSVAKSLALQTALGAAIMAQQQSETSLAQLRQNVTSPGGTTAAAIDSFSNNNFKQIIAQALEASVKRGQQLAEISKP